MQIVGCRTRGFPVSAQGQQEGGALQAVAVGQPWSLRLSCSKEPVVGVEGKPQISPKQPGAYE